MQRVETLRVLHNDREEDRTKVRENERKEANLLSDRGRTTRRQQQQQQEKEMNPDVLIRDGKAAWRKRGREEDKRDETKEGSKDEAREMREKEKPSGRACVPDFWSRSMIFSKRTNEGGGLRMAAMELDLAGGLMANRVAWSWKMRLCALESRSLPRFSPRSVSSFILSLLLPLFSVSMCLYLHAHMLSCYTERPNSTRVRRSISI